jgi:O-antigen chain-terminating methyltransferase
MTDDFYRAFEDRYRGSRELIKSRLRVYLPFVEPLKQLYPSCTGVDLGCGRGEWLELMTECGIDARGVDLDEGMLTACRERGLAAEKADAIDYLRGLPDASVAVVSGFHVAEHIPFEALQELVQQALRVLKPAGLLILETPNPENLSVGTSEFYYDPTHQKPIPPPLLQFLPDHYGFARTKVARLQEKPGLVEAREIGLDEVLSGVSPDYAVIAQKTAASEEGAKLFDGAFNAEYGLTLEALTARFQARIDELAYAHKQLSQTQVQLSQTQVQLSQTQDELSRTLAQLEAVYTSTSWRLTSPLRALVAGMRRSRELPKIGKLRVKTWLKPKMVKAGRMLSASPRLKAAVLGALGPFPRLRARLARSTRPNEQPSSLENSSLPAPLGPDDLTKSGRQVYQDLLDARVVAKAKTDGAT